MRTHLELLCRLLVFAGSALMVRNIIRYYGFTKRMRWMAEGRKNRLALYVPLMLLLSFLAGYLATGLLGSPGLVTAFILFGGSVFVLVV